ncbi:MAG: mechanosensitive ion channel family protein [Blastocatellia bacterium]
MKKISFPLMLSLVMAGAYVAVSLLRPQLLDNDFSKYFLALILLGFSIVVVRAAGYVLFDIVFLRRKGRQAPAVLRTPLSIVLYVLLFALIYNNVIKGGLGGIGLLATSTVVSVIIGLALQDTLGNFFAGLSLHIEQPFHILDAIKIADVLGRVESVTWRTTTLRTNNNSVVIFPNSKLAREQLEVHSFNSLNRRIIRFPAPYSIPPERVIRLTQQTAATIPNVASEKTPVVRLVEFADSSITYELLYWVKDYMLIHDIDSKIKEYIWYIYHRNQIDVPFPVRHVLMEQLASKHAPDEAGYEQMLQSVEILEPLNESEREALARSMVKHVYAPGELILRRGEPGNSMFIIERGRVEVQLQATDGKLQQVAVLERGNFFGEMALLTGEPRAADVTAFEETEILEIRKPAMKQLLEENAELAEALSQKLAERQLGLDEYARAMPEEDRQAQKRSLLGRIQRFFGLR